ncbi:MAG: hypothetical protein EBT60_02605 [Bacteroidetes bacterium]|nr:hypothetical protein [Bacteroidota bacterium]
MWVAWYLGLVINGIVTTIAVSAAIPQAMIKTLRQRQKKLMTSAKLRGLMLSAAINSPRPLDCALLCASKSYTFSPFFFDVMGLLSQSAKITIQTRANA